MITNSQPFIKTTDQGLEYLGGIMPYMFTNNTIFLYEKLYDHLLQYIKNYSISTEGLKKAPYKSIINIYNNETDFKKYPYNKVILGKNNFDDWINNLEINKIDPLVLDESRAKISVVFPYIDGKKNHVFCSKYRKLYVKCKYIYQYNLETGQL